MHADLQRLLNPNLLVDLPEKPMDRLRAIRVELSQAEGDVSLVRRVTQGRMDIVGHEVERRGGGTDPTGGTADPNSLLFDMPDILADGPAHGTPTPNTPAHGIPAPNTLGSDPASRVPASVSGRKVSFLEPGKVAAAMIETLDAIASPSQLSGLDGVHQASLSDLLEGLREFELELSSIRRDLHDRIDAIQDEIARRYRDGEASVDALLQVQAAEDQVDSD